MKPNKSAEKPRKNRTRPAVFFVSIIILGQAACATKSTNSAAPADLPRVLIDHPRTDTSLVRGETLSVTVSIRSIHELASVRAFVVGAANYQFPPVNPADTIFSTVFNLATTGVPGDSLTLTVTAVDILGNRGVGKRSVFIR